MKLCDNPSCHGLHCDVELRPHDQLGKPEWSFVSGFRTALSKVQLEHFDPNAKVNYCKHCMSAFVLGMEYKKEN